MSYDAIIIGAGPGGYSTAIRLGQKGKKVLLIEKDKIGGECLNYGCIPSKAFIELGNSISYLKDMPGVDLNYSLDMNTWQDWKWSMINKLTSGVETLCKSYGVEVVRGEAYVADSRHVKAGDEVFEGENLVIATGSSPIRLDGFEGVDFNREILDIKKIPESLVIIGGGYIGIELGTAFAKLGTKVTIIEMMQSILPEVEHDLVRPVQRRLRELNVEIRTSARVSGVRKGGNYTVSLEDGTAIESEKVLLTVGRVPNTKGLGLENLQLEMDGRFIKTDRRKKTNIPNVYAIGDVSGGPMLAHKAFYEADVVADNISGEDTVVDYRAMPYVIYSDPEIAYTGKFEGEHTRFPAAANGRSLGMNNSLGNFSIYYDEKGYVKGAGIVAPHSSELISEITLAIESGLLAMDIGLTIHPHPTISEGVKESAEASYGKSLHFKSRS